MTDIDPDSIRSPPDRKWTGVGLGHLPAGSLRAPLLAIGRGPCGRVVQSPGWQLDSTLTALSDPDVMGPVDGLQVVGHACRWLRAGQRPIGRHASDLEDPKSRDHFARVIPKLNPTTLPLGRL